VRKAEQVKTLANVHNVYKLQDNEQTEIDSSNLFHRLIILAQQCDNTGQCFNYELTTYPTALFKDGMMRKPDKPSLYRNVVENLTAAALPTELTYVVDGGCLLHKVRWKTGQKFGEILQQYVSYVWSRFGRNAWIVFDGYKSGPDIKDHEHKRRCVKIKKIAPTVEFGMETTLQQDQECFLSNITNKKRTISMLIDCLRQNGFHVIQSEGDADTDIVSVGVELASVNLISENRCAIAVFAEDTDILALLLYHWQSGMSEIFFVSDGKKNSSGKCINVHALQNKLGLDSCKKILVLHAFGGCDTTSAVFGHGKGSVFKKLDTDRALCYHIATLQSPDSTVDQVKSAGVALMIALYGGKPGEQLGDMRYTAFMKMLKLRAGRFQPERLPPTQKAAELHAQRVHLQAVVWGTLGKTGMNPKLWGWIEQNGHFSPIAMADTPGPPNIMDLLRCKCTSACKTRLCSCRKSGFKCLPACSHCHGTSCENAESTKAVDLDSDDEEHCNDADLDGDLPDRLLDSDLCCVDEETIAFDCGSLAFEQLTDVECYDDLEFFVDDNLQAELCNAIEVVI
jgi:hypothetical protein